MADDKTIAKAIAQRESIPPMAIVVCVVLALGIAGFFFLEHASKQPLPAPAPLTAEAKAYLPNLKVSHVEMKAHESFLKQSVVEITGELTNAGNRVLKAAELNCVFSDPGGKEAVLSQRVPIVSARTGPVLPGETKLFRLPFDTIPEGWNNVVPFCEFASISFQ